jgi:hypothetical protein
VKIDATIYSSHKPCKEDRRVSRLRENLTSGSEGEGLETDRKVPRQSFTRQIFFGWWKRHLRVYHLIARSDYGLMVQILSGLITYLLLVIYCRKQHNEKVSIKRVRELRIKIQNETRTANRRKTCPNPRPCFENF